MADNKSKDDKYFNCEQEHERQYVSGRYSDHKDQVYAFLKEACADNSIKNSTHNEVYALIAEKLGLFLQD